ncbi:hypothetical protein JAAARDRAFT_114282, partial [Jaapia argillacea MUCL 33604]
DKLNSYLSTDCKHVNNVLMWWTQWQATYPTLCCMALNYLSISATSVDIEHIFSCGQLVLSHVCNHLLAQMTCAILCLSSWSLLGLVKDEDVLKV